MISLKKTIIYFSVIIFYVSLYYVSLSLMFITAKNPDLLFGTFTLINMFTSYLFLKFVFKYNISSPENDSTNPDIIDVKKVEEVIKKYEGELTKKELYKKVEETK